MSFQLHDAINNNANNANANNDVEAVTVETMEVFAVCPERQQRQQQSSSPMRIGQQQQQQSSLKQLQQQQQPTNVWLAPQLTTSAASSLQSQQLQKLQQQQLQQQLQQRLAASASSPQRQSQSLQKQTTTPVMPLEIAELDDEFVVFIEVPGVPKEQITLDLDTGLRQVIVSVDKTRSTDPVVRHENVIRSECRYGKIRRALQLPNLLVDLTAVTARHQDGVLIVRFPKQALPKEETMHIPVA
jgi:HSP20 family molecular chaperone IbpA